MFEKKVTKQSGLEAQLRPESVTPRQLDANRVPDIYDFAQDNATSKLHVWLKPFVLFKKFFATVIEAPENEDITYTVSGTGVHEFVGDANFNGGLTIDGWTPVEGELYVGPTGPKGDKGDKGDKGAKGDKGDTGLHGPSMNINAIGLAADRSVYNNATTYFLYFATDTQLLYQKMSSATGDWSPGIGYGVPSPILDTSMISTANNVAHSPSFIQGRNYLSIGPIDIDDGVTVDIPNDTVWVVV